VNRAPAMGWPVAFSTVSFFDVVRQVLRLFAFSLLTGWLTLLVSCLSFLCHPLDLRYPFTTTILGLKIGGRYMDEVPHRSYIYAYTRDFFERKSWVGWSVGLVGFCGNRVLTSAWANLTALPASTHRERGCDFVVFYGIAGHWQQQCRSVLAKEYT